MTDQTFRRKLVWGAQATLVAFVMTLCLGAGTGAFAQTARIGKAEKEKAPAGQKAETDDKTGKANQDEPDALTEAMKKMFDRPTEGLKTTYLPNGAVMVELTQEFMEVSVIKINPDGSKSVECVTGMKAAEESLKARGAQKPGSPAVKGAAPKTPQKTIDDKSKWEVK
jgi:hypothetical protein